jgi:hypothetical protein
MTLRTRSAAMLVAAALALSVVAVAPPAQAENKPIEYRAYKPVCKNDGLSIEIGGNVFQKELGKSGVRRFKVKWLVYRTNVGAGFNPAYAQKSKRSVQFPDDAKNYWWDGISGAEGGGGSFHRFKNLPATNSYKLVAKLTWERPNRKDWNRKIDVAYCS